MDATPNKSNTVQRVRIAFRVVALPWLVLFVLFGLPLVGNLTSAGLSELADCGGGSGESLRGCILLGRDISGTLYAYGLGIFLLGALNPWLFFELLGAWVPSWLLAIWSVSAIALTVARWKMRRVWHVGRRAQSA